MSKNKIIEWLEPDKLKMITAWARDGLTEEQIAHNMGIGRSTLSAGKVAHPDIVAALKKGKEVVDVEVENALYKRAVGYSVTEVTRERVRDPETGMYTSVVTKEVTKDVLPDVTAQIFWLKNRKPAEWRDKQELSVTDSSIDVNIKVVE